MEEHVGYPPTTEDIATAAQNLFGISGDVATLLKEELESDINDKVDLTEGIFDDVALPEWCRDRCILGGSRHFLWKLVSTPIHNVATLRARQVSIIEMLRHTRKIERLLHDLAKYEKDVTWLLNTDIDIKNVWPLNLLFPSGYFFKYLNYNSTLLDIIHLYRCVIAPLANVVTPVVTVFAPLMYLRKTMRIPMTVGQYLKFLFVALKEVVKLTTTDIRAHFTKIVSCIVYLFMYFYSMVQSFQYAHTLYTIRKNLMVKISGISKFVATFQKLNVLTVNTDPPQLVPCNTSALYHLIVTPQLRSGLKAVLHDVYKIDTLFVATKLLRTRKFTLSRFVDGETRMYGMGHMLLGDRQVVNPCALDRNLIITGPNAAGKTTYTKAIMTNIILSQTFGISRARYADIVPTHAIGSFMRVTDVVGTASLFEAEVRRCSDIITQARRISDAGKRAVYFMDEPMHSTPPAEGTATSFAVIEYLGKLPGIRVILTTHYHSLRILERESPEHFRNISMEALPCNTQHGAFVFPYKIRRGASLQSIALELLKENELQPEIVSRAIEIKNKICGEVININAF